MIRRRTTQTGVRYEVRLRGTDGKERSRSFRTRKEAERYERSQHNALDAGVWIDPRKGKVTLADWSAEWRRTVVHLRPTTQRIYDANLRNHVLPALGPIELNKLTPSMLRAWLSSLTVKTGAHGETLAPGSVAQVYRTLHRVLAAAVDNELLGRNPLHGVKPPAVPTEPMRFLDHDEVASLATVIDPRYRAFVLVGSYCGLRAGELVGLRRRQVDRLRSTITVVEQMQVIAGRVIVSAPKSAAGRRAVPVPSLVADALRTQLGSFAEAGRDGLIFPAPDGGHLRIENFRRRVWTPATIAAGVAPLRIHDMRHTCASLAIAAGADVKVLQRMLGHSSASLTLDRYGHLLPGQAQSVAERLDEFARAAKPLRLATISPAGYSRDERPAV